MAKLLLTNGLVKEINPKDKESGFSLEEIYSLIGCNIFEVVYLDGNKMLLIDEEGKLKDIIDFNMNATTIFKQYHKNIDDFIAGNAIYCDSSELK